MRYGKALCLWLCVAGCDEARSRGETGADASARPTAAEADGGAYQPATVPTSPFPGSGSPQAASPLPAGDVCDAAISTSHKHLVTPATKCLRAQGKDYLAATLERVLECSAGKDTVHLRLTFDPGFVDNTYGAGSIGWPRKRGHTLVKDLTKSDHAQLAATSGDGKLAVQFKLDYISEVASAPSGFGSLGVRGGDGAMLVGDPAWIVQWNTSLSRNLNERGYADFTVDSPATDAKYTPNAAAPDWDYRVVYEAWIDVAAFGSTGFGDASIAFVHASPAKAEDDTLKVEPGDCPPPECQPDDPKCAGTGGVGGSSAGCGPDDPECTGTGGIGGRSGDCGPDDPQCTGQGGIGGRGADCAPDAPDCWKNGNVAGAPEKPRGRPCPEDQPGCSPD